MTCRLGEAILPLLKIEIGKFFENSPDIPWNTLNTNQKSLDSLLFHIKLLADIKLLKIWTFEIPAALNLLQKLPALDEALLFALISSKLFWCSGLVRELIIQGSPVRSSAGKFFKKKFLQKSSFLLSNCNIHTPFEIRNIFQWSVFLKNVNESLMDYVKYQIFKAS